MADGRKSGQRASRGKLGLIGAKAQESRDYGCRRDVTFKKTPFKGSCIQTSRFLCKNCSRDLNDFVW